MRGHVRKRGESWTVVYDERRDEDRKRVQRSKGGFATRREAQAFLTDTLSRLGDGSYAAPSKTMLGEYLTGEWLPAVESTLRPTSFRHYSGAVRLYIVPSLGQVRLQALSGGHLNALYRELEQRGLSASTRRVTHAVLHRALRDAVRWGRLVRNPADMADPPPQPRPRAKAWTAQELSHFLEQVRGDRLYALWRLAATTGMRRGELAGVTWRAVDLDGSRLSVEQQLIHGGGAMYFGPPKSARSRRTIALDPETVDALRDHRDAQLLERDFAGTPTTTTTSFSPTRSAARFTRRRSLSDLQSTGRRPGSRPAPCTRCAIRLRRWRSRPGSQCTSWRPGSGTTQRRCSRPTRTCCRSPTRSPQSAWQPPSRADRRPSAPARETVITFSDEVARQSRWE
jgi:integrase